jgi:hypothetical protein
MRFENIFDFIRVNGLVISGPAGAPSHDSNATHEYVERNMTMKEETLAKTTKPKNRKSISSILKQEKDVLKWLEAL